LSHVRVDQAKLNTTINKIIKENTIEKDVSNYYCCGYGSYTGYCHTSIRCPKGIDVNGEHFNLNLVGKAKAMPGDYDNPDDIPCLFRPIQKVLSFQSTNQIIYLKS